MPDKRWLGDIYLLASKALRNGATRKGATLIEWDISGKCARPYRRSYYARPSFGEPNYPAKRGVVKKQGQIPMEVVIITACHVRCDACLRARASLWTARALAECQLADNLGCRTWFGTLTLTPDAAHLALIRARAKLAEQGIDYDTLSEYERFGLWHAQIAPELKKFTDRLRKTIPAADGLRYLLVCEKHKSGVPHYHALVHERKSVYPIRHKTLKSQWRMGFSDWSLLDMSDLRPARYICKYLAKSSLARVRASLDYGKTP